VSDSVYRMIDLKKGRGPGGGGKFGKLGLERCWTVQKKPTKGDPKTRFGGKGSSRGQKERGGTSQSRKRFLFLGGGEKKIITLL